jgi:hypothetical protein
LLKGDIRAHFIDIDRFCGRHGVSSRTDRVLTYYCKVTAINTVGEGPLTGPEHATPTAEGGIDDNDNENEGSGILLYAIMAVILLATVVFVLILKRKRM